MGNHLHTLDGNAIGDDERGNAAQWVKKQDDIYGEAMELMHKEWPNFADEARIAKAFAIERQKHAKKKYRKLMPGDIETKKDKKKENNQMMKMRIQKMN